MLIRTQELFQKNNEIYKMNEENLRKSIQRLSTGNRINSASDDVAGLEISERFKSKINGSIIANNNVASTINLLNTADGGLSQITDLLQRVRELTIQAQNGTYTAQQKGEMQNEVNQMLNQIDQISNTTNYNGIDILERDGGVSFQNSSTNPSTIRFPNASFIPTTATQPRTYDMLVQVDGYNINSPLQMARLFQTQTGYLSINAATGEINIRDNTNNYSFGVKMPIGQKTRVSFVFDGSQATLYLNGEKKSTLSLSGMTSTAEFDIGNYYSTGTQEGIVGTVYEANYYSKALTQQEIQNNYNGETTSGAVGSWDFEESQGTTVQDKSGKGNNGIIVGNTIVRTPGSIRVHTGSDANDSMDVSLTSTKVSDLNLSGLDITSTNALQSIDHSLEYVYSKRTQIGSEVNRLNYDQENLQSSNENHTQTFGRLTEADMSKETSDLTKEEIKQQMVSSMFSKIKEYYQSSLQLLQG